MNVTGTLTVTHGEYGRTLSPLVQLRASRSCSAMRHRLHMDQEFDRYLKLNFNLIFNLKF